MAVGQLATIAQDLPEIIYAMDKIIGRSLIEFPEFPVSVIVLYRSEPDRLLAP